MFMLCAQMPFTQPLACVCVAFLAGWISVRRRFRSDDHTKFGSAWEKSMVHGPSVADREHGLPECGRWRSGSGEVPGWIPCFGPQRDFVRGWSPSRPGHLPASGFAKSRSGFRILRYGTATVAEISSNFNSCSQKVSVNLNFLKLTCDWPFGENADFVCTRVLR